MSRSDWYSPTDVDKLRLENDLLGHEVRFLRSRHRFLIDALEAQEVDEFSDLPEEKRVEMKDALHDLRWLLIRLDTSSLGWLMRRKEGFEKLKQRWL